MFVVQPLQVSVLSELSVPAEADRISSLVKTTPPLSPSDHQHSMAAHLKDTVGGHLVDRGEVKELPESANQLEYKLTSTDKLLPRYVNDMKLISYSRKPTGSWD